MVQKLNDILNNTNLQNRTACERMGQILNNINTESKKSQLVVGKFSIKLTGSTWVKISEWEVNGIESNTRLMKCTESMQEA